MQCMDGMEQQGGEQVLMMSTMEESGTMSLTCSSWKLKQEGLRSQRNFRQLQNRLVVLQLEREGKVKSIERKLEQHKRHMDVRVQRRQLDSIIGSNSRHQQEKSQHNSRVFRHQRMKRAFNIRTHSSQVKSHNNLLFHEAKQQRMINESAIQEERERELRIKAQKRNKVRMIEIEAKENVEKYWRGRIEGFQGEREREVAVRLAAQERQMEELVGLEKTEEQLLGEIKKAEEMETQLERMMAEEKQMLVSQIATQQ